MRGTGPPHLLMVCLLGCLAAANSAAFDLLPPGAAQADFSFFLPETGQEYRLSMRPVSAENRPLWFLEHRFDYESHAPGASVTGVAMDDLRTVYASEDLGATWTRAAVLPCRVSLLFTTRAGSRLAWDPDTLRLRRFDSRWQETPVTGSGDTPWLGTQSIGERTGVILYAEYWLDTVRTKGHVWRSLDDGQTWDQVLSMPSLASAAPKDQQITHFHTVQPDPFFPGHWYLSSGDARRQIRVWLSKDDGATWAEVTDPAPEGTDKPGIQRFTSMQFEPDRLLWATDDTMGGARAQWAEARRGEPLEVKAGPPLTRNHVRSVIATEPGQVLLTENAKDWLVPGIEKPGVEIGLVRKGRYLPIGLMPDVHGVFCASLASHQARGGVFFSSVRWERPSAMLRWELQALPARPLGWPSPHRLAEGPFAMAAWPASGFPEHMLVLQSAEFDPRADAWLPYVHQPSAADTPDAPVLHNLGENGVAFENKGSPRDFGGLLLALDTRDVPQARLRWTGRTLTPQARACSILLQYRPGDSGPFREVLLAGTRMDYKIEEQVGEKTFSAPLPPELLGQAGLQLLWRYRYMGGNIGPRPILAVDDILVEPVLVAQP